MATFLRSLNDGIFGTLGLTTVRERIGETLDVWQKRVALRRELTELSFRDIQDIGVDQAEIDREIAKPFWQA